MPAPRRCFAAAAAVAAATVGCGGGQLVTLGEQPPPPLRFDTPRLVAGLMTPEKNDNPTLTADLLEIFFTSSRGGNTDVWTARRASPMEPFGVPELVAEGSAAGFETSSAIALDGLTLWFASDRPGGAGALDIWVTTRATRTAPWSAATNVASLSTPLSDLPRPPGQGGLVMPLASDVGDVGVYRTYFSTRATPGGSPGGVWGAPQRIPELVFEGRAVVDAFLTDDGLALFYTSGGAIATGDLYVARRRSTREPFTFIEPLSDLNTPGDDRDPWLSPDGTRFFFASDRDGVLNIYEASVRPRP